jgi:hypothetical protein
MATEKRCPDCDELRPVIAFSRDRSRRDGLAAYCRVHARLRLRTSKERRHGPSTVRRSAGREVPPGWKWCPDCDAVKPMGDFPSTRASKSGRHTYCKPCHNVRGRATLARVGGARTYHLKRRYGISAADADAMLLAQGGLCAVCQAAPAAHVDHDHATAAVRELLCFNCNGGLGQFRDDPAVLRAAADYVERHRARQATVGEGSAGSRPAAPNPPATPPVGSASRRSGRPSTARRGRHTSTDSRQQAAGEADA